MSKVYVHIGNAKAYSTSIQVLLSENISQEYQYLGFQPNQKYENWFLDKTISRFLDFDLRFSTSYNYAKRKLFYLNYFKEKYALCKTQNKDLWISSETISMRYLLEDIDISEKLDRLQSALPSNTTFLIVFRNIWASLISIYKEFIKQRYTLSFDEFCNETYYYRDCNFLFSLMPGHLLKFLEERLKNNNTIEYMFLDGEDINNIKLLSLINKFKKNNPFKSFPTANKGIDNNEIMKIMELNKTNKSSFDATGLIETHRSLWHIKNRSFINDYIFSKIKQQKYNQMETKSYKNAKFFSVDRNNILLKYLQRKKVKDKKEYSNIKNKTDQNIELIWKNFKECLVEF